MAIGGGSEASMVPVAMAAFANMTALSSSGNSRPFDARRDGFVMTEGAAALVLEDWDRAVGINMKSAYFATSCALRDIKVVTLIEEHGEAQILSSARLFDAAQTMLRARATCGLPGAGPLTTAVRHPRAPPEAFRGTDLLDAGTK